MWPPTASNNNNALIHTGAVVNRMMNELDLHGNCNHAKVAKHDDKKQTWNIRNGWRLGVD